MSKKDSFRYYFRYVALAMAAIIGVISLYYTNIISSELRDRERKTIDLFAKAQTLLAQTTDTEVLIFLVDEINATNNSIPVIVRTDVVDVAGIPPTYESRNLRLPNNTTDAGRQQFLAAEAKLMALDYSPIILEMEGIKQSIFYRNSDLLFQLRYYPYVQLSVIGVFALLAYLVFNYSRRAEQNRLWAGLAKETAHQLGTPISSLMAWTEYMKSSDRFAGHEIVPEIEKDIEKLSTVAERFSNIGSVPTLEPKILYDCVKKVTDYLERRVSKKVTITLHNQLLDDVHVALNASLFEWVIENICKNAIDAITPPGSIELYLIHLGQNRLAIDITDTGKGIPKSKIKRVFEPGYTSKKRGWGLGLALARRIIENYHNGRIFVKSSETGKGTTFRIILNIYMEEREAV